METLTDGSIRETYIDFSEADYNPVGSYIKKFSLNREMYGKRIRLCALTKDDAESFAEWSNDSVYLNNLDTDFARIRTKEYFEPIIDDNNADVFSELAFSSIALS